MRTFINQFLRPVYKFIRRLFLQFLFSTSYIFFRVCWTALVSGPFIPDLKKKCFFIFCCDYIGDLLEYRGENVWKLYSCIFEQIVEKD